jgi:hypothetical protein
MMRKPAWLGWGLAALLALLVQPLRGGEDQDLKAEAALKGMSGVVLRRPQPGQPIEELELGGGGYTARQLAPLGGCSHLREIRVWNSEVPDSAWRFLRGLARLEKLVLYRGASIGDGGLRHLRRCCALRVLALHSEFTSDTDPVTDAGLRDIAGLDDLHELRLPCRNITDAGFVERLRSGDTDWGELRVWDTRTGALISTFTEEDKPVGQVNSVFFLPDSKTVVFEAEQHELGG